jgi:hypothetical protein
MSKLKLLYKLSPIFLVVITLFAFYFAYHCWQDEKAAKAEAKRIATVFAQYKEDNKAIKQLEKNLTEALINANNTANELRNNVDNGLIELRVKVESAERDSATASNIANKALRLARTSQQDYYHLTNAISYNKVIIDGWREYYCKEIAPKNNTEFMCE